MIFPRKPYTEILISVYDYIKFESLCFKEKKKREKDNATSQWVCCKRNLKKKKETYIHLNTDMDP